MKQKIENADQKNQAATGAASTSQRPYIPHPRPFASSTDPQTLPPSFRPRLPCRLPASSRRPPNRKHKRARSGIARPRRRIDWLVSHDSPHAAAAGTGTGGGAGILFASASAARDRWPSLVRPAPCICRRLEPGAPLASGRPWSEPCVRRCVAGLGYR